jgi:1,4-alpha-glucan branching enzyme
VCVLNFTPIPQINYRIGVPEAGYYKELLNTDSENYWGSNMGNYGGKSSEPYPCHSFEDSIDISIPPLSGIYFRLLRSRTM